MFREMFINEDKISVEIFSSILLSNFDYATQTKSTSGSGSSDGISFNVSKVEALVPKLKSFLKKNYKITMDTDKMSVNNDGVIIYETFADRRGNELSKRDLKEEIKVQERLSRYNGSQKIDRPMKMLTLDISIDLDGVMISQTQASSILGIKTSI